VITRMSAAMTFSWIAGQSSRSQPCSVMSGQTPVAIWWSTARITSTDTPCATMIAIERSARPWVCEGSGDRFAAVTWVSDKAAYVVSGPSERDRLEQVSKAIYDQIDSDGWKKS